MGFEVRTIAAFEKDFKKLSKKYPSLIGQLEANPFLGTSLGKFFIKLDLVYQAKEKVNQLAQE
jgi:hypothetical protein